jgi:hypothetical protein
MKFSKGDILVPKERQFPEGAFVVDGYDERGRLVMHPLGGGLEAHVDAVGASVFRVVTEDERVGTLFRSARFALADTEAVFNGWTDGRKWNGWEMPRFERSEAQRVIKELKDGRARFDAERDAFVTISQDGEEEVWPAESVVISDGSKLTVYGVGAGAWIWDEVEASESSVGGRIRKGAKIVYNDGRSGHVNVVAVVLEVDAEGMTVQFEDRADTTYIRFTDRRWMDFISVEK